MAIIIIADAILMPDVEIDLLIDPRPTVQTNRDEIIDTVFKDLQSTIEDNTDLTDKKKYLNSFVTEITVNNANVENTEDFELNLFMKPKFPIVCDIRNFMDF